MPLNRPVLQKLQSMEAGEGTSDGLSGGACLGTGMPGVPCLISVAACLAQGPVLSFLPLVLNFLSRTSLPGCGKL